MISFFGSLFLYAPFCTVCLLITVILINAVLMFIVKGSAKAKGIADEEIWSIATLIGGFAVMLMYFLATLGIKGRAKTNKLLPLTLTALFGVLIALIPAFQLETNNLYGIKFSMPNIVCYDKEGKEYGYSYYVDRCYYTEDGEVYSKKSDYSDLNKYFLGIFYLYLDGNYTSETGEAVSEDNAYIDENGFFVIKDYDSLKHFTMNNSEQEYELFAYDNKGNVYYKPTDCSWDKNGKLVITDEDINKLTKKYKQLFKGD